ncbi:M48 family metallopeptidase [Ruminiclostridium hungatei]|uniref:M48 family metallopeptidase n=1 Tax=Ruminiclostridium hungatei TaxID=48256 RepID=UPI0013FDAF34|nr:SprT family zinc-dependent metalloprotease [Ruminiclostridium hungatei]
MKTQGGQNCKTRSIMLGGTELSYVLKRSGRKSIGISVDKAGNITVAAPQRTSEAYIEEVLLKKGSWILDRLEKLKAANTALHSPRLYAEGESFPYLGRNYSMRRIGDPHLTKPAVRLGEGCLEVYSSTSAGPRDLRAALKKWYVEQFCTVLQQRIGLYAPQAGVSPGRITVREQKTRWGSCSSRGNLNFNWKLIMAPLEILDYVVIHELCHMKELNHSADFWAQVQKLCPNYKNLRKWLRENGHTLSLE